DVGNIHLPQIVWLLRQQLKEPCSLIQFGCAFPRFVQQLMIAHHHVCLSICHLIACATTHHRDSLIAVPGVICCHPHHGVYHLTRNRLRRGTRTLSQALVQCRPVPTTRRDSQM